jgi:hypothetical protein
MPRFYFVPTAYLSNDPTTGAPAGEGANAVEAAEAAVLNAGDYVAIPEADFEVVTIEVEAITTATIKPKSDVDDL